MARRDRSKSEHRAPHPAWAWASRTILPTAKTAGWLVGLALLVGVWLMTFVHRSPYFWVSSIEVQMEPGQRWVADPRIGYRLHPPVHILQANLPALATAIQREHPQLAGVVVHRELPNRLVAQVTLREPVGQLRGRQYYLVSADGLVLAPGASTAWEGLPVLLVGSRATAYQPGQSCASPELRQAMAVLGEVQRAKALGPHRVSAVRVALAAPGSPDSPLVTLVLESGLELRVTPGDLAPRLARLGALLHNQSRDMEQAQYVDLRFDDLVVGMRGDE